MVMHHCEAECHGNEWVAVFKVTVALAVGANVIKMWLFQLYRVNWLFQLYRVNWCFLIVSAVSCEMMFPDCFSCIVWTDVSFANKPSLVVDHHKEMCPVRRLDCCVQDQGHNDSLKDKTWLNVCQSYIFCTIDVFATKLGVLTCC